MSTFILSLLVAFLGTYSAIKVLKPIAIKHELVDKPNERKLHVGSIPLIGGLAVYVGFVLSLLVIAQGYDISFKYFLLASGGILLVGMLDDKYDLSVRFRMFCQIVAASVMMFASGDRIENLGNLLVMGDIHLGWAAVPFTYLAIMGAINAYNMVDGIDGLVGGVTFTSMLSLSLLFILEGFVLESWIALCLVVALIPYLIFNLARADNPKRSKIFMGDAGSMFVGLSVVWLLAIGSQGEAPAFKPVTALWVIAIPLMDMAGVMIRRKRKGQSPFKPDRDHLHHIFMRAGFTSRQTLICITLLSFSISMLGVLLNCMGAPDWLSFGLFLVVFAGYLIALKHVWRLLIAFRRVKAFRRMRRVNQLKLSSSKQKSI
ncbi:UDP-N-acetylglucosamine--undecaprenyl-phosphate N-acetylglucosaminephosphotransferase [Agarivorans sp. 1_MG-2023]|uniref:UDP-N-acetylglucosamine--undecaprenyl-phosphate N-acetylglucosaminephosphotransferase n=1 Tax=Agarivorans sp. 1_MG-2023 TaxID=3062634 RepID=UPI0026E3621D|nr:UDP-N-acetylglucosamine--undecaprenyl-phosphate N-acetylglucosaminephosphotransferase [Agarivorans sp. 1_MG-2023]MDO6764787.1 UDP-N-acetylglucosamine--undecaprenyl-phosphate N-acetylglucosaminephosphotransferase [Agarivorans sp. 1_MG-2023]